MSLEIVYCHLKSGMLYLVANGPHKFDLLLKVILDGPVQLEKIAMNFFHGHLRWRAEKRVRTAAPLAPNPKLKVAVFIQPIYFTSPVTHLAIIPVC